MKKAKQVTFQMPSHSEVAPFKPLYLFSTENSDSAKQIRIFISSNEKNCYIQEKDHWQKLIIKDLLLGCAGKTYCFSVKQRYRYLDIPYQNQQPYLTRTKNSKDKLGLKNIELSEELLQELTLPNLEQLDTSLMVKTKLEAEKVFQLKSRIAERVTMINQLNASLLIFIKAKEAMEKLGSDEKDFFTGEDIDAQIKLLNRQIHHCGFIQLKNEIKIEMLVNKETYLNPKSFERDLLELRLQKKEITQVLQNLEEAINALKKMADEIPKTLASEDPLVKKNMNQEIQLLEKKKLGNRRQLDDIEEKIKTLKESKSKSSHEDFLITSQAKQLFFNAHTKETYPIEATQTELKTFSV